MKPRTCLFAAVLFFLLLCTVSPAAAFPWTAPARPEPVVMLSDLHFDPFRDPARLPALRAATVDEWAAILAQPASATQAADYAALQTACHARGEDSDWAVVHSALQAASAQQPHPLFVLVGGDLLVHNFDCRLRTLAPGVTPDELSAFAAKSIAFLAQSLKSSFGEAPVYLALGNNDSGCSNYHQSVDSSFLQAVETTVAGGFTRPGDVKTVLRAFSHRGDYSVLLPRSMHGTRLVVLQDVFETPAYGGCNHEAAPAEQAAAQIHWLREQLLSARKDHQKVWVLAHVPPGIDTYASFHRFVGKPAALCTEAKLVNMLGSNDLASTLTEFAPEVKLALFAHTHMDEFELLHNAQGMAVAAKLIPSVSPVNGNVPSFLIATVQPQTATLLDYVVFAANDTAARSWTEEYRFSTAYRLPAVSADSVSQIATRLAKDRAATDPWSITYLRWFFPGDDGSYAQGLKTIWPAYGCAVKETAGPVFEECMCPAGMATTAAGKAGK